MPENPVLETRKRTESGTRSAKRLRGKGLIPAVMYGAGVETELLAVDGEALYEAVEQRARMVELKIGSKKRPVIIKDVQFDHLDSDIQHVDFEIIKMTDNITINVSIETHGTPRGVRNGGILELVHRHVAVECKPNAIPREITVEVAELKIDDVVTVADLAVPEGVRILDNPGVTILSIQPPRVELEEEEAVSEEMAEPEVIGQKKQEEEEAE